MINPTAIKENKYRIEGSCHMHMCICQNEHAVNGSGKTKLHLDGVFLHTYMLNLSETVAAVLVTNEFVSSSLLWS